MAASVTLEEARKMIAAATAKATEIGQPMNIAVCCAGGYLLAFERMPKAWLGSVDIAQKKAWTSRAFNLPTKTIGENAQSGRHFFGIHASNDGKVMIFAGGLPIADGDDFVGGIGISGGSGEQDQQVAEAGLAAFKR